MTGLNALHDAASQFAAQAQDARDYQRKHSARVVYVEADYRDSLLRVRGELDDTACGHPLGVEIDWQEPVTPNFCAMVRGWFTDEGNSVRAGFHPDSARLIASASRAAA